MFGAYVTFEPGARTAWHAHPLGQTLIVTAGCGPVPARAYINELLPGVLEGRIEPGRVFDFVGNLEQVPDGYHAMDERKAIKALIEI